MSSGDTHAKITKTASIFVGVSTLLITKSPSIAITTTTGCMSGIILSPDLDIPNITLSEAVLLRHKSPVVRLLGILFVRMWQPYGDYINHRHPISHAPIFSTIVRMAYLLNAIGVLHAMLVYKILNTASGVDWYLNPAIVEYFVYFIIGLSLSDTLHWLADVISSHQKRNRRKRR